MVEQLGSVTTLRPEPYSYHHLYDYTCEKICKSNIVQKRNIKTKKERAIKSLKEIIFLSISDQ